MSIIDQRVFRQELTLLHSWQDGAKVIIHKNDVGSLFRDVRAALAHRYPNIRHLKCRSIVHCNTFITTTMSNQTKSTENLRKEKHPPIARHGDDRTARLKRFHNRHLMFRLTRANTLTLPTRSLNCTVVIQLSAEPVKPHSGSKPRAIQAI